MVTPMYHELPNEKPDTPLLDQIESPADLRNLERDQLAQVADEVRRYMLWTTSQTGGHFGAGLGVVELTVALHYLYDTPNDRLVWDVGHQTYPHKILTGRKEQMLSMRQKEGLAGFPKRSESEYDTFGVGHSSTSIGAALGMALGAQMAGEERRVAAVIGDGAMTAGMAFEALSHGGATEANMLVILNDNFMSISHPVGGLSSYLAKMWSSKLYTNVRQGSKRLFSKVPSMWELARRTEEHIKGMVAPGTLFEELGFNYVGPIDGNNLDDLLTTISNMKDLKGPQLLHVVTRKGKGFGPAEEDPVAYHALGKLESKKPTKPSGPKYQDVFGSWLCDRAASDKRLVAITPAMCEGSGMTEFRDRFSDRFHDVAIAEQHAVTLAAGLACEKQKPVVAIYSTFLQRAYDQLIHDVAVQNLDVTFAIDRAGLVGEDGPTHAGSFDLSYLRCIPNMIIAAPSDENECRLMLETCYQFEGPSAVRYPRGGGPNVAISDTLTTLPIGEANLVKQRSNDSDAPKVAILNFGALLERAKWVAYELDATLIDMRWIKPLDHEAITAAVAEHDLIVTIEENAVQGGAGSAVNELILGGVEILNIGIPDTYIDQGTRDEALAMAGLSKEAILEQINAALSD